MPAGAEEGILYAECNLDLGIQNAIKLHYRKRKVRPKDVLKIGAKWSPYASIACWYLWRSLDGDANLTD